MGCIYLGKPLTAGEKEVKKKILYNIYALRCWHLMTCTLRKMKPIVAQIWLFLTQEGVTGNYVVVVSV